MLIPLNGLDDMLERADGLRRPPSHAQERIWRGVFLTPALDEIYDVNTKRSERAL